MKRNQSGFSLLELLIVVVIIGIIAAIAIPNILAAKQQSENQKATVTKLKQMASGEAPCSSERSNGYDISITIGEDKKCTATAVPEIAGTTGSSGYALTKEGTIYRQPGGTAPDLNTVNANQLVKDQ